MRKEEDMDSDVPIVELKPPQYKKEHARAIIEDYDRMLEKWKRDLLTPQMSNLVSAAQQSSLVFELDDGQAAAHLSSTVDPLKKNQMQLQSVYLFHAVTCKGHENQSNGEVWRCTSPHCRTMKHVLNHMVNCSARKLCAVPRCSSSREILRKWQFFGRRSVHLPQKQTSYRHQQAGKAAYIEMNLADPAVLATALANVKRGYAVEGNSNSMVDQIPDNAVPVASKKLAAADDEDKDDSEDDEDEDDCEDDDDERDDDDEEEKSAEKQSLQQEQLSNVGKNKTLSKTSEKAKEKTPQSADKPDKKASKKLAADEDEDDSEDDEDDSEDDEDDSEDDEDDSEDDDRDGDNDDDEEEKSSKTENLQQKQLSNVGKNKTLSKTSEKAKEKTPQSADKPDKKVLQTVYKRRALKDADAIISTPNKRQKTRLGSIENIVRDIKQEADDTQNQSEREIKQEPDDIEVVRDIEQEADDTYNQFEREIKQEADNTEVVRDIKQAADVTEVVRDIKQEADDTEAANVLTNPTVPTVEPADTKKEGAAALGTAFNAGKGNANFVVHQSPDNALPVAGNVQTNPTASAVAPANAKSGSAVFGSPFNSDKGISNKIVMMMNMIKQIVANRIAISAVLHQSQDNAVPVAANIETSPTVESVSPAGRKRGAVELGTPLHAAKRIVISVVHQSQDNAVPVAADVQTNLTASAVVPADAKRGSAALETPSNAAANVQTNPTVASADTKGGSAVLGTPVNAGKKNANSVVHQSQDNAVTVGALRQLLPKCSICLLSKEKNVRLKFFSFRCGHITCGKCVRHLRKRQKNHCIICGQIIREKFLRRVHL